MKKVEAILSIEVNVECPHCEGYFNLLNNDEFPQLNDEGQVIDYACPSEGHWVDAQKDYCEEVECPGCGKEFMVDGIGWF